MLNIGFVQKCLGCGINFAPQTFLLPINPFQATNILRKGYFCYLSPIVALCQFSTPKNNIQMKKQYTFLFIFILTQILFAQSHIEKVHEKLKQQYDFVSCFDSLGTAIVSQKAKFGYVNLKGKIIVPFLYEKGEPFSEGKAAVKRNGKWGFVDSIGKEICPFVYDSATLFQHGFGVVRKGKQLYWLNTKGEKVDSLTEEEHFEAWQKNEGFLQNNFPQPWRFIQLQDQNVGIKEIGTDRIIFPPIYDFIDLFEGRNCLFKLEQAGRHYLGNGNTGNIVPYISVFFAENRIEAESEDEWESEMQAEEDEYALRNTSPFMCVQNEAGNWGVLDTNFQVVLPFSPENKKIDFLQDSLFWVISPEIIGKETVETKADAVYTNPEDADADGKRFGINSASCATKEVPKMEQNPEKTQTFAIISNKMGIKNVQGKWLVLPKYNLSGVTNGNYCLAYREGNWYLLNFRTGQEKYHFSPNEYVNNTLVLLENGLLLMQSKNGFWGIKDTNGSDFLAFEYTEITYEKELNYFCLRKNGKWGIIDVYKKEILPIKYAKISKTTFNNYFCLVSEDRKMGFANEKGEIVIPLAYDCYAEDADLSVFYFDKAMAMLRKKGKWGAINPKGEEIIPFIYDIYNVLKGNPHTLIALSRNGKWTIQNLQGKKIDIELDFPYENNFNKLLNSAKGSKYDAYLSETATGYGLINTKGEILLPFHYSEPTEISQQGFTGVYDLASEKVGLADTNGKLILPLKYTDIGNSSQLIKHELTAIFHHKLPSGYFKVVQNGKVGLVQANGKEVFPCVYTEIGYKSENEWWVLQNDKVGLVNEKGKILLPIGYEGVTKLAYFAGEYEQDTWVNEGLSAVSNYYILRKQGKQILINDKNKHVLPKEMSEIWLTKNHIFVKEMPNSPYKSYDMLGNFEKNLNVFAIDWRFSSYIPFFVVIEGFQYQVLTENGDLLPEKYDQIFRDEKDYFVQKKDKIGYLNGKGELVIPPDYEILSRLEGIKRGVFFEAKKGDKRGILDANGKEVLPLVYDGFTTYQVGDGFSISQNGKWGKIDTFFRLLTPLKYKSPVYGNTFKEGNKMGWLNENGGEVLPPIYENIQEAGDYVKLKLGAMNGVADKQGKIILPLEYENIDNIDEASRVWRVQKAEKWGLIALQENKVLLPLEYEQITAFHNGYSVFQKGEKCGVVDSLGKIVVPLQYEGIEVLEKGFLVKMACKYGFLNLKGEQILPLEYEMIEEEYGNYYNRYYYLSLWRENVFGIYDFATQKLISPKYAKDFSLFYKDSAQNVLWEVTNAELKKGLMNAAEEIIIPMEYDAIELKRVARSPEVVYFEATKEGGGSYFFSETGKPMATRPGRKPKCMCER